MRYPAGWPFLRPSLESVASKIELDFFSPTFSVLLVFDFNLALASRSPSPLSDSRGSFLRPLLTRQGA